MAVLGAIWLLTGGYLKYEEDYFKTHVYPVDDDNINL
jgi:hypothetical protein